MCGWDILSILSICQTYTWGISVNALCLKLSWSFSQRQNVWSVPQMSKSPIFRVRSRLIGRSHLNWRSQLVLRCMRSQSFFDALANLNWTRWMFHIFLPIYFQIACTLSFFDTHSFFQLNFLICKYFSAFLFLLLFPATVQLLQLAVSLWAVACLKLIFGNWAIL